MYFNCVLIFALFLVVEGSSLCSSVSEVSSCYAVLLPFNHWSSCLSLPGSIITDIPSHWIILYFKMKNFIGSYVWNKQISNELSLSPHQPFSFPQWEEIRSHFNMFFMLTWYCQTHRRAHVLDSNYTSEIAMYKQFLFF